jgi:MFS family permease
LSATSQARLVNNLNVGMSWGIFPLFFAAGGLSVARVGILVALYPAAWGGVQLLTGPFSDRYGRKWLIAAGMWAQAAAIATDTFGMVTAIWVVAALPAAPGLVAGRSDVRDALGGNPCSGPWPASAVKGYFLLAVLALGGV